MVRLVIRVSSAIIRHCPVIAVEGVAMLQLAPDCKWRQAAAGERTAACA
jgi:hypothetical protein